MTLHVAKYYQQVMSEKESSVHLVSLENKNVWERGADMLELEEKYFIPSDKLVFILPEYNGSFPGILKLMIDNSDIKKCWWHKKAMLVGVADGRGGNLRGLEHFTGILHYMKVNVLYHKVLISRIKEEVDAEGKLLKDSTAKAIDIQVEEFLHY